MILAVAITRRRNKSTTRLLGDNISPSRGKSHPSNPFGNGDGDGGEEGGESFNPFDEIDEQDEEGTRGDEEEGKSGRIDSGTNDSSLESRYLLTLPICLLACLT